MLCAAGASQSSGLHPKHAYSILDVRKVGLLFDLSSVTFFQFFSFESLTAENKKTSSAFPSAFNLFSLALWSIYSTLGLESRYFIFCRECSPGDYQRNFKTIDNFPYKSQRLLSSLPCKVTNKFPYGPQSRIYRYRLHNRIANRSVRI